MSWVNDIDKLPDRYLANKLKEYIVKNKPANLFNINVYELADNWNVDRKLLLSQFILGVKNNIFSLKWEFHCPHCGGAAKETLHLNQASTEDFCPNCDVDFSNSLDQNIEVQFSINEAIKKIPAKIKMKFMKSQMMQIKENGMLNWKTDQSISGLDCINMPEFSAVFGNDILALDQSLEIKHAVILFTDIKESTAMYEKIGDGKAFSLVRDHFRILFQIIENESGKAIKTIGDAIMGVFTDEVSAVKAAVKIQKKIKESSLFIDNSNNESLELKVGVHSGSTIMVTLNDRLDYFGSTVNKAARVQSLAKPNQILISSETMNKDVLRFLKNEFSRGERFSAHVKGIKDKLTIYRFE